MPADLSALLAHLRGLREKATPGPWEGGKWGIDGGQFAGDVVVGMETRGTGYMTYETLDLSENNAALIVAAVNALPVLLRELEALEEARRSGALERGATFLDALAGDQRRQTYFDDAAREVGMGVAEKHQVAAVALRRLAAGEEPE